MPLLKAKVRDLNTGGLYLAFSAQSKMLSSNGTGGVLVKYVGNSLDGRPKVEYIKADGSVQVIKMARLDEREDAFLVPVNTDTIAEMKLVMGNEGTFAWPQYTARMKAAKDRAVPLKFVSLLKPDERYPEERNDGTYTLIVETTDDSVTTYLNHSQVKVASDTMSMVCTAEQLEAKKREEARAKVAKMKEGGVKLTVGKMEAGASLLDDLMPYREELNEVKNESSTGAFIVLYGKDMAMPMEKYVQKGDACHREIRHTVSTLNRQVIISSVQMWDSCKELKKSGALQTWVDYLINRSPYADIFIDKDVERVIKYGYVINCNAPSNAISSACTGTRHTWEYPMRAAAFHELSQKLPENLAFFISLAACGSLDRDGQMTSLKFNSAATEHTALKHQNMSDMGVMHWMYGAPCNENPHFTAESGYTSPYRVWALFEPSCKKGEMPCQDNRIWKQLCEIPQQKQTSANPFEVVKSPVEQTLEKAIIIGESFMEFMDAEWS